jgi:hypothetical protein
VLADIRLYRPDKFQGTGFAAIAIFMLKSAGSAAPRSKVKLGQG